MHDVSVADSTRTLEALERFEAVADTQQDFLIVLCRKSWYRREVFIVTVEVGDG